MRLKDIFAVGEYFPTEQKRHKKRIERYKENQKLFKSAHYDVFERVHQRLTQSQRGYRIYYRKLSWAHLQKVSGFSVWRNADIFGRQRKGPLARAGDD
ncbi:hypothetical protein P7H22_10615 [Paenibacillus larvae]|nr:hypothetical protein [Paenibacillus larvae]MDT2240695.1 hypothetical protein [Paenibacillus larvae]